MPLAAGEGSYGGGGGEGLLLQKWRERGQSLLRVLEPQNLQLDPWAPAALRLLQCPWCLLWSWHLANL